MTEPNTTQADPDNVTVTHDDDPNVERVDGTEIIQILGGQLAEANIQAAVSQARIAKLQAQNAQLQQQLAQYGAEPPQDGPNPATPIGRGRKRN